MMRLDKNWDMIRKVFESSKSSFHCSIATVNADGTPNVIPIGSLELRDDMSGYFFDSFLQKTAINFRERNRICVLAVNSDLSYWHKSLKCGVFDPPPAIRLMGIVLEKRKAIGDELEKWLERISYFKDTPGYNKLWKDMNMVWDLEFDSFEPTVIPSKMLNNPWIS